MDLDELMDAAAPPTAARTAQLRNDLESLARNAETQVRSRRRRSFRSGVAGVVVALGLGATTAAATGVVNLPSWPMSTATSETCQIEFSVTARGDDGEPASPASGDAAEQQRTADAAMDFLADYDFDTVDRQIAVRSLETIEAEMRDVQVPSERQPKLEGNDLEVTAVSGVVWEDVEAHLRSRGMDPLNVSYSVGWSGCSQ